MSTPSIVTPNSKSTKSVSFASKARLRLYKRDRAGDETTSLWYTQMEYSSFRKDCLDTARLARRQGHQSFMEQHASSQYSLRGIEHLVDMKIIALRKDRRRRALDAVLMEQDLQQLVGIHSKEKIAQAYRNVTTQSQADARELVLTTYQHELFAPQRPHEAENMRLITPTVDKGGHCELALQKWIERGCIERSKILIPFARSCWFSDI